MVNFVAALAYHFCLVLPATFTQTRDHLLAEPSNYFLFRLSVGKVIILPSSCTMAIKISCKCNGHYLMPLLLQQKCRN